MNKIFIVSSSLNRLNTFFKYYNYYKKSTYSQINLIIDDRKIKELPSFGVPVYKVTDIVNFCKNIINSKNYDEVLKTYPVSIKLLLFLWINEFLKIKKSMIMDDDVLLLSPLDHYFENDYAIKTDHLSSMSKVVKSTLVSVFGKEMDDFETRKNFINSGQIIYTQEEILPVIVKNFFDSDIILNHIQEAREKSIKRKSKRHLIGRSWILEQYVYGYVFHLLRKKGIEVYEFSNDVKMITTEKQFVNTKNIPKYIHYLPSDKSFFYENFIPRLEKIL